MDDLLIFEGKEEENFSLPRFKNYEELKEILENSLSLYEDFKKEFIKEYS